MNVNQHTPDILPDDIGSPSSILDGGDIRKAFDLGQNYLISEATKDPDNIRQSSYELRVDNAYELLKFTYDERQNLHGIGHEAYRVEGDEGHIHIRPGQTLKLYTKEELSIPKNVLARVNTRGQIYESGLAAENTYVDPGFGLAAPEPIHITVVNVSNKIIKIPIGSKLARIEFYRLGKDVQEGHEGRKAIAKTDLLWEDVERFEDSELQEKSVSELRNILQNFENHEHYDRRHHISSALFARHEQTSRNERINRLLIYLIFALLAILYWPTVRGYLPEELTEMITEKVFNSIVSVGVIVVVVMRRDLREAVRRLFDRGNSK